jgi:hypothetical protein
MKIPALNPNGKWGRHQLLPKKTTGNSLKIRLLHLRICGGYVPTGPNWVKTVHLKQDWNKTGVFGVFSIFQIEEPCFFLGLSENTPEI